MRRPSLFEGLASDGSGQVDQSVAEEDVTGYLERESHETALDEETEQEHNDKCVDLVLSDMWEPWDPLDGLRKKSISNPYFRLMNTSGNAFRDHAGSMVGRARSYFLPSPDLCIDMKFFTIRTYAAQPSTSATTPSKSAATSYASSTRAVRTRHWRSP